VIIRASLKQKPMNMRKLILLTLMIAALASFKTGSTRHITGTVFGNDDKSPITGATVKMEGTNVCTVTNQKGAYAINVPEGKTHLIFTFIGYQSKNVKIDKTDTLNVYLDVTSSTLNEVLTVGYGTKRKSDLTGSIPTVSAEQQLQEKVAGVAVYDRSIPANSAPVRIRNIATVNAPKRSGYVSNTTANPADESYKPVSENGFLQARDNPLSTFSTDVDAASYSNVRRFINNGQIPPAQAVRVEEMINYFKYNLSGPAGNAPVAIHTELSSAPWNPEHRLLRIGLKARNIDMDKLPSSNFVFLLDVSGSMGEANKLPLVKAAMKMLVDQLRPQDKVAIVVYSGQAGLKLASTPGDQKSVIKEAIDQLQAGGSTAGGAGINLAYRIARENFMNNGNNRIIMATDGDFNVGDSSDGDMETLITRERSSNVPITIMGFGMGNLKDSKMETLADKGNGNYAYIDNLTEARKALISEYGGTMFMVAKDIKLQVEFNPAKVQAYRLLGYEDRLLAKEDFNNDKKDAGDMGSGHAVTAFYEIIPTGLKYDYTASVDPLRYQKTKDAPVGGQPNSNELLTIKFRYKQPDSGTSKMSSVTVTDTPINFKGTTSDFRFASAVAEFGMLLRSSEFKQKSSFDQAISIAKEAKGKDDDGYRSEFVRLAETAKALAKDDQLITKE
jgi:Ca-activated chloride channel family protein